MIEILLFRVATLFTNIFEIFVIAAACFRKIFFCIDSNYVAKKISLQFINITKTQFYQNKIFGFIPFSNK